MLKTMKRLVYAGMFLLPLGAATLHAQATPGDTIVTTPTAEGTVIKNVASATFTDENNNTYSAVKDSISIRVGFLAAPNPTGQASYTPASPSTGNIAAFTITNSGNGIDSMTVSVSVGTGLTISKYTYNGTDYTLATLNALIKTVSLASGASLPYPVNVVYSVDGSSGGKTALITLTQLSVRTPAKSANWRTSIIPPVFDSVTVSPDGAKVAKVPSNGAAAYTYDFTVTNRGNHAASFGTGAGLSAAPNGTVTISGTSPSSTGILAPGASKTITVSYTVADGTAPDKIVLSASGPASDDGDVTVSVSKAKLSFSKTAWTKMIGGISLDSTTTAVVPGDTIFYKLAVTNAASSADAHKIVLTDVLNGALLYARTAPDVTADWAVTEVSGTVTATLDTSKFIAAGATRYIWIAATIKTVTTPPTP